MSKVTENGLTLGPLQLNHIEIEIEIGTFTSAIRQIYVDIYDYVGIAVLEWLTEDKSLLKILVNPCHMTPYEVN